MFFAKRRWAVNVIEKMGLNVRSSVATELIDMIVDGAKQCQRMTRSTGVGMSDAELTLMAVAAMSDNRSAFDRLKRTGYDAEQLLTSARVAGQSLSIENGFQRLVDQFYSKLPEVCADLLSNKATPSQVMVRFHRDEIFSNITAARKMEPNIRIGVMKDLLITYLQIDAETEKRKKSTHSSRYYILLRSGVMMR